MLKRHGVLPSDPNFTEEQVVKKIRAHTESGWWPSTKDAAQIPGLPPGTTCNQLDAAIRSRCRGFTRENDSLIKMLKRHGVLPSDGGRWRGLTEEQVVKEIRARIKTESGWWPNIRDATQIPGLPPGTTCKQLDAAIRQCNRGFTRKNDSLSGTTFGGFSHDTPGSLLARCVPGVVVVFASERPLTYTGARWLG